MNAGVLPADLGVILSNVTTFAKVGEYFRTGMPVSYTHLDVYKRQAQDSRMDAVPVWDGEKIRVVEFRNIKAGDMIVTGRTEDASEGIYVHDDCWVREEEEEIKNTFAFRQARSRETSFTQDYNCLLYTSRCV